MAFTEDILLHVEEMKIYYPVAGKRLGTTDYVKAVDGVSFEVRRGEVFGIVGESGCGKSTLGRGICKLEKPTGGKVILDGEDISGYGDCPHRIPGTAKGNQTGCRCPERASGCIYK